MKRQETSILAALEDPPKPKQPSFIFNVFTTLLGLALSVAWIYCTRHFMNEKHKGKVFSKNPLTTLDHSIDLLSEVGFYSALYMVTLTFTIMMTRIFNHSINPAVMGRLEPAEKLNELIRSFTQALIMFGSLFLYLLENSKKSAKVEQGFYLPFWFLSGYGMTAVGYLLEIVLKRDIGVTKFGQFVVVQTFGIVLAEIGGVKVFKRI